MLFLMSLVMPRFSAPGPMPVERKPPDCTPAHLRALIESTRDMIWSVDLNYRLVTFNKAFSDEFKYNHGIKVKAELGPVDLLTPDRAALWPPLYERALKEGPFQTEYRRADGGYLELELNPIVEDGIKTGVWVFCKDITERKRAEIALRESEEFLRESQEIAGVGSYSLDIRTDTWTGSDVMDRIFGIGKEYERTAPRWADLIQPEDRAGMVAYFTHEVLGEGKPFDREYRIVRPSDGAVRWVHGLGRLEFDAQGRPVKMRGTIKDITERKQAEIALRESNDLMQLFIEHAPVSIAMFDREIRYLAASRQHRTAFGLAERDIIGHSHYELFPNLPEHVKEAHRRALAGEAVSGKDYSPKEWFGAESWNRWSVHPWYTGAGAVGGTVLFGEDITERTRAEKELADYQEKLVAALASMTDSVCVTDASGEAINYNDAFATFHRFRSKAECPTSLSGMRELVEALTPDGKVTPPNERAVSRALRGETAANVEYNMRRRDTGETWIGSYSFSPIRDSEGSTVGAVVVARDITERKRAEAAIIESRAKLEAALASMTDAICICDTDGRMLEFNEAFARFHKFKNKAECGTTREENRKFVELLAAGGEPEPFETRPAPRALRGESGTDVEYTLRRKDTGETWIGSYNFAPIRGKDGAIVGAVVIARDVTEKKRAEAALRESKELLQLFIEQAPVSLAMFDNQMRYLAASRRWKEDNGLGDRELTRQSLYNVVPEIPERWKEAHRRGLAGEVLRAEADRFERADGSVQWIRWEILPWRDAEGGVAGILIFTEDVTQRIEAEEHLRDSKELLQLFIKHSPAALVMLDREMRHMAASLRWLESFSLKEEEIIGRSHYEVLPYVPEHWKEAHRRGMAGEVVGVDAELFKWPDGTLVWTRYEVMPWRKGNGDVGGIIIFGEDITERKAAQEALERAEEKFREIFQDAPEGIFQTSPEGRVVTMNPASAEMLGYESAAEAVAAIQDAAQDLWVYPEERARFVALLEQQGTVRDYQYRFKRKDGKQIWLSATVKKITGPDGKTIYYQGFNEDITEQKRLEAALQANARELQLLSEINNTLVHAKSEEELLRACCRIMVETGGYRMAWVGFAEEGPGKPVVPVAHYGYEDGYLKVVKITWADAEQGQGPGGRAIRSGKVEIAEDFCADPVMTPWHEEALQRGYHSVIALPLRLSEGNMASLIAYRAKNGGFSISERRLMEQIASDLAYGIANQRAEIARTRHQEDLRAALEQTIDVIAETVDQRDPYTAGHERRVADLCMRIAQKLGLPEDRSHGLHLAASIHDLGKIGIPAEILSKPGLLTSTQFNLLKEHVQLGYDILKDIAFPWPIAEMILQHHERLDGSGYPQGLKADAISLEARILAVADVVEAMSSHRPYRASKGIDVALDEILAQSGTLYDAQVADACARIFREDGYEFPAQAS